MAFKDEKSSVKATVGVQAPRVFKVARAFDWSDGIVAVHGVPGQIVCGEAWEKAHKAFGEDSPLELSNESSS